MLDGQPRRRTTTKSNGGSFAAKENSAPEVRLGSTVGEAEVELYSSPDCTVSLPVRVDNETVWATQDQMAEPFRTARQNVTVHRRTAYNESEPEESTRKESLQIQREGTRKSLGASSTWKLC